MGRCYHERRLIRSMGRKPQPFARLEASNLKGPNMTIQVNVQIKVDLAACLWALAAILHALI